MVIPAGVTRLANSDVRNTSGLRGTVQVINVRGPSDSNRHPIWIWRPPGHDSSLIPVVYLLHGYPGTAGQAFSSGLALLLNQRLREGYQPFVVACPDGNGEHHADTEWANSWDSNDEVMSRVVDTVVPAVEGASPRDAAHRVIAGFSMGGFGAMNIAMQNPGVFGQVVSIDGYFIVNDLSNMFGNRPRVKSVNDPSAHPGLAHGLNVILEEDSGDPLSLVRGQAAWFAGLLGKSGVPATLRIRAGTHSWAYALRALGDSLTYVQSFWQRHEMQLGSWPAPTVQPAPAG